MSPQIKPETRRLLKVRDFAKVFAAFEKHERDQKLKAELARCVRVIRTCCYLDNVVGSVDIEAKRAEAGREPDGGVMFGIC